MVERVFVNATILTQDASSPRVEALAVDRGRIVAAGAGADVEALAGPGTERVDLEGGTLLPGFNDSHVHVWKVGQLLTSILDLRPLESLEALKRALVVRDAELGGDDWLLGRGYNEARMSEGRQPTRRDLDEAVPGRPLALTRTCGHMMVANSRALELAGITRDTRDPPGGALERDASGEPTGLLQETAMGLLKAVLPEPSVRDYAEMVAAAHEAQLRKGITSASEAGAYPDLLEAYRQLAEEGSLRVRSHVMAMRLADEDVRPLPLPERVDAERLLIDSVKLFADGGLSGATAALEGRYRHDGSHGLLRAEEEELFELALEAQEAGFRVCTHAIGDAAIERALRVYERLNERGGRGHRFEHFGLPTPSQIQRARRIGAIAAPQTVFIRSLGPNFRRYLTDDYLARTYPVRSMLESGLVVALGSDAPVVPDDHPLVGIEAAVTRRDLDGELIAPDEALTPAQAVLAYTLGGARACGREDRVGSLSPGKWADMVLLDRDPLQVPAEEISSLRVLATFVEGEALYRA